MLIHLLALSALYNSYVLAYLHDQSFLLWVIPVIVSAAYFTLRRPKVIVLFCLLSCTPVIFQFINVQERVELPFAKHKLNARLEVTEDSVSRNWGEKGVFRVLAISDCSELKALLCSALLDKKIQLNDYKGRSYYAGEVIQTDVVLKPVLGFLNPGSFDYEHWAYAKSIVAKGYMSGESLTLNNTLSNEWYFRFSRFLDSNTYAKTEVNSVVDVNRVVESDSFLRLSSRESSIIRALVLGQKNYMSAPDKDVLSESGLIHLFVISGLHIGLLFGAVFLLCKVVVISLDVVTSNFVSWLTDHRLMKCALLISLVFVWWYVDQIGYPIPAFRALIFLVVWTVARLLGLELSVFSVLSLSVFVILSLFPHEVASFGFWMSCLAVLSLSLVMLKPLSINWSSKKSSPLYSLSKGVLLALKTQGYVLVMLFPIVLTFGVETSIMSLLWNLAFIPLFGLCVVPLLFLGVSLFELLPEFSLNILVFISESLVVLIDYLSVVNSSLPKMSFVHSTSLVVVAILCGVMCLVPQLRFFRVIGLCLFCSLFLVTPKQKNPLDIWFLDVGQGLSVVMISNNRAFIYDTGFSYGDFNAADSVIIPFLRSQKVTRVDALVVSHKDNDHSGGMRALIKSRYTPTTVIQNFSELNGYSVEKQRCDDSLDFDWQGLSVQALWPGSEPKNQAELSSNNSSCVLLLSYGEESILLTGDITTSVERHLVETHKNKLNQNIRLLSVPHHGSKTSSSLSFLKSAEVDWAVISSGPLNRFGHPHASVVSRYQEVGSKLLNTAELGALHFGINAEGKIKYFPNSVERFSPYWRSSRLMQ